MNQSTLAWRLSLLTCLYFSQGLPFGVFSQALPPLLRQYGVDLEKIGLVSLIAIPWALKFLWAPYVDQFGSTKIGRHKSWILPMQLGFILLLFGISLFDPNLLSGDGLYVFLGLMFLANLFAATQDIATDGLAVQTLAAHERGFGNSVQVGGYKVGMVFGGGLLLVIIDRFGWQEAFWFMCFAIAIVSIPIIAHRENSDFPVKGKAGAASIWTLFIHFIRQPNIGRWLMVIIVYKSADSLGSAMGKPFLVDAGFDLETIGWMSGGVGMVAGIIGAVVGGFLIPKIGRPRALLYFGVIQASSFLGYAWVSGFESPSLESVLFICTFEHFTGGMATVALFTAMMDACRVQVAGTDYTIQASIQVVAGGLLHAASGFIAGSLGYQVHFLMAAAMGIVVLFPVLWWTKGIQQEKA